MIKRVHIQNFRSLQDVRVDLDPVTVFIGQSGSGKSNFVDALRWLRDYLHSRNEQSVQQRYGGWGQILCATASRPLVLSFSLVFTAPGFEEDFKYDLCFRQEAIDRHVSFASERLSLGGKCLFHQDNKQWVKAPDVMTPPPVGQFALGALTGLQEAAIAHLVLTRGIGCYSFPDRVLTSPQVNPGQEDQDGLRDDGSNFLRAFVDINLNLDTWQRLRDMAASLRRLKPSLKNLDLQQPTRSEVTVNLENEGRIVTFGLRQESEGFRRLLACLLALYQTPAKQTLIFDEPEKGIYPAGLAILADEFKGYASKGWGQILLTTHSPEFLNQFTPEQIRVVEMRGFATHIGPVAADQYEALKEHFLRPRDLLTVTPARLDDGLAKVG